MTAPARPPREALLALAVELRRQYPFKDQAQAARLLRAPLPWPRQPSSGEDLVVEATTRTAHPLLRRVEERRNPDSGRALFHLELREPVDVSAAELGRALGVEAVPMGLSSPHRPDLGAYAVYRWDGVELRAGFTDLSMKRVTGLLIDAAPQAR